MASPVTVPVSSSPPSLLSSITSEEALAAHIQKMVDEAIKSQVKQTGAFNTPISKSSHSLSRTRIMERNVASVAGFKAENQGVGEVINEEDNSSDLDDDTYDEAEAQQLSKELESVVKAGFHIDEDGDDDAPIKFGDLVRQREATGK